MDNEQAQYALRVDAGRISRITIMREARRNALDRALLTAIADAVADLATQTRVRAVVITGAGDRAFAAGADLAEIAALPDATAAQALSAAGQAAMQRIADARIVTVAAINGAALGGGCELALACDFRIAHATAKLGMPEVTLGLLPGFGGTQRLVRLIGRSRALRLMLDGRPVDARRALDIGLVDEVTDGDVTSAADRWLEPLIAHGADATAAVKEAVRIGADAAGTAGYEHESRLFGLAVRGQEGVAGVAAFLARRAAS